MNAPVQIKKRHIVAVVTGNALEFYDFVTYYLATYAIHDLRMGPSIAFGATVIVGLCGVLFQPVSGILSDRFGRKPVMLVPLALLEWEAKATERRQRAENFESRVKETIP